MTPAPVTQRDAVIRAYTGYWPASVRAAKLPRTQGRQALEPYALAEHLAKVLDGAAAWQRKGFEPWGYITVHVLQVAVTGQVAQLTECQDASTAGVASSRTHQLIPGTRGAARVHIRVELRQGADGRWRLKEKERLETPCMPSAS